MTTQLNEKTTKNNPWKSATLCLIMALAAPAYAMSKVESLLKLATENKEATAAELQAIYMPWMIHVSKVAVALVVISLIAGVINIVLVTKGGRKWTLIFSSIGILASLAVIVILAIAWMNIGGQS